MTKILSVSISPDDLHTIDNYCKNNSINRSLFVVRACLKAIPKVKKK